MSNKSDDILRRHFALDVVDVVEDIAAVRFEGGTLADIGGDSLGRAGGQDMLGVAAAAPEHKIAAKLRLSRRVHVARADWTGFRMWMPLSISSGTSAMHEPQV